MQHSGFDFFCFSDVPEVFAEVAACSSCDVHFGVIFIAALRAFPFIIIIDDNFAVVAAHVAVIRFCIKLGILDIVINKLDNFLKRLKIVTHIRYFHIRNRTAGRNLLELALKCELAEGVYFFADIDMIRVCIIALVCHILNFTEALQINSCETVAE